MAIRLVFTEVDLFINRIAPKPPMFLMILIQRKWLNNILIINLLYIHHEPVVQNDNIYFCTSNCALIHQSRVFQNRGE